MTRHTRQHLPGTLGGGSPAVHRPHQRVGGADTPQADGEDEHLPNVRDLVLALGPSNEAADAHVQIAGKWALPLFAVGDACQPDELLGRDAFVAGGAFEFFPVAARGCALGREPGIGWPPARVATDAGHPLALAVARGRRALPRQHRHQRQAGFIGWHGRLCAAGGRQLSSVARSPQITPTKFMASISVE